MRNKTYLFELDNLEDYDLFKGKSFPNRNIIYIDGHSWDSDNGWSNSFYDYMHKTAFVIIKDLSDAEIDIYASSDNDAKDTFAVLEKIVQELKSVPFEPKNAT